MPVTTSPSSVSLPSRPSKRETAPRPQSETRSLPAVSEVSAKEEPVCRSRGVNDRDLRCASSGSVSPRSQSAKRCASRRASSSRRASRSSSLPGSAWPPIRSPASATSTPDAGVARIRPSTATSTCSATVRPKRAIHAFGIAPLLWIVPTASSSAMRAAHRVREL